VNLGAEVVAAPYSISWDTTAVVDGSHTITAVARDAANNVSSSSVVVNVANNPVVSTPYFLSFDGVNDYLEVADADSLSFGNGTTDTPLTIETWFRPNTMTAKQNLIGKWGDGSNQEYKLYIASGTIRLDLRDSTRQATISAYTTSSQVSLTGGWHHLAVTYDGRGGPLAANGVTIYVDGVVIPINRINNASYVAMQNSAAILQIGRESAAFKQYNGALDEIRLWNVARTQDNIQTSASQELTGAVPGLNGYWRLNEGAGSVATDDSQSGNIATIRNGVTWNFGGPLGP
jgi:Concanavalin A-like lectin/glucanases superfamily